jgi:hypothetical protein
VLRNIRNKIRRADVFVSIITAILGIYLAGGGILLGADVPSEEFWDPWRVPFVVLLVAAIYVPIYGFYKAMDARFEAQDRHEAELQRDLIIYCQRATAELVERCPEVTLNQLAAHVWLCQDDGTFDRCARFFLPHFHKSSGVDWRRGKGVAGMAWELNRNLIADLTPLYARRKQLGDAAFDELPAEERYGMSAQELEASNDYHGVAAILLFSTGWPRTLLGVFLIDYTDEDGGFDCIEAAIKRWQLGSILGACETVLTEKAQAA